MSRPVARRDFVFDSGALTYFAEQPHGIIAWLKRTEATYEQPGYFTTDDALVEGLTGNPRRDALIHRFINALAQGDDPESIILRPASFIPRSRAGWLRTQAISSGRATTKRPISIPDAMLVALAEERSTINPVTIVTGDAGDIGLLVDLTGATNIAVLAV